MPTEKGRQDCVIGDRPCFRISFGKRKQCFSNYQVYITSLPGISPTSEKGIRDFWPSHTLKTAVRNLRVSSSLMEPSSFPYMSNTVRAFALSCFPQNVLIPLLVDRCGKSGQKIREKVSRFKPTSAHDNPGHLNLSVPRNAKKSSIHNTQGKDKGAGQNNCPQHVECGGLEAERLARTQAKAFVRASPNEVLQWHSGQAIPSSAPIFVQSVEHLLQNHLLTTSPER